MIAMVVGAAPHSLNLNHPEKKYAIAASPRQLKAGKSR